MADSTNTQYNTFFDLLYFSLQLYLTFLTLPVIVH
ncbi:hypothetical protein YPPY48_2572, partial [Yersinia pestis PY-48]